MNESRELKNDGQLEELLLLTEEIQSELEQKEQLIVELKTQLGESLTLNEKLNRENRAGNIQALKNDLRKANELLQREKEKTQFAQAAIEECRDRLYQAERERDYVLTHQKKVEIPVEKQVLYEKCRSCDRTAYQKAKEKYETKKGRLSRAYRAKTAMYQTTMFLLAWYSLITTIFQAVQSEAFLPDSKEFINVLASFLHTFIGWTIAAEKFVAQISRGIPNDLLAGMVYWLILIVIVGGCIAGGGILAVWAEIKMIDLYKKNCWDIITVMMILISAAVIIYFGKLIKNVFAVNLLLLWLILQGVYLGIRCYLKGWREATGYY